MDGKIVLRIVAALVLIAAIAGVAFFAFNAGVVQGVSTNLPAPEGQPGQAPYPYFGYGMPFHHPFGFGYGFGCFGLLIPLFLFFLAMKAFRFLLWGPRWGHMQHHGPWGRHGEGGPPTIFEEWHKRAHEVPVGGGEQAEENKE